MATPVVPTVAGVIAGVFAGVFAGVCAGVFGGVFAEVFAGVLAGVISNDFKYNHLQVIPFPAHLKHSQLNCNTSKFFCLWAGSII